MNRRIISYSASRSNRDWTTRPYQLDRHSSEYGRTVLHTRPEPLWHSWAVGLACFLAIVAVVLL